MARDPALRDFLSSAGDALAARDIGGPARAAIDRIYGALATPAAHAPRPAQRLPACGHLPAALSTARRHSAAIARIADSFARLEPALCWVRRSAGGPHASATWPDGHANATLVGPGGLEPRDDVQIGVSLLAPGVRYPDHTHAPEEVYLVLSPGRFQHGGSGWFEPGIGGTLYNEPNIRHAMASGGAPLWAAWFLWTGSAPA